MAKHGTSALLAGTLLAFVASAALAKGALQDLTIKTASGPHVFKVELARTELEREQGLMFRKSMPNDQGMLFEYEEERPVTFWMRNTYLPLDMLFIDKAGRVVSIKHDAKPMDDTLIPSDAPTLEVLELNAGVAAAIGAKVGDEVRLSGRK